MSGSGTDEDRTEDRPAGEHAAPPQSEAGIDRAGTGHGGPPDAAHTGRRAAGTPTSHRPGDEEGPTGPDGAQHAPDPTPPASAPTADGSV